MQGVLAQRARDGGLSKSLYDAVSSSERMAPETDESSGPLLVLFWTCTPESSPLRLAISKSPRRFGHVAISLLNPSNICDSSPWSLEIMRQPRQNSFGPAVENKQCRSSRSPQDNGQTPIRVATLPPMPTALRVAV